MLQVDQAIMSEEDRVVIIRFGHDWDPTCMVMDETLYRCAEKMKNFAVIYLVDITEVGFHQTNEEYEGNWKSVNPSQNEFVSIDLYGDGAT